MPVTVKPLRSAEAFLLDLTANNTVEWEQTDDLFRDLDQELRVRYDIIAGFSFEPGFIFGDRALENRMGYMCLKL